MAYPVTHILVPMILLDLYRRYIYSQNSKKKFSYWWVLLAGFAGAAPDFDILISVALGLGRLSVLNYHRAFSHSFLFVIPFLLAGLVFFYYRKHYIKTRKKTFATQKTATLLKNIYFTLFILSFAVSSHILLDFVNSHTRIFYPLVTNLPQINILGGSEDAWATLDAVMLCLWLVLDQRVFEPVLNKINAFFKQ